MQSLHIIEFYKFELRRKRFYLPPTIVNVNDYTEKVAALASEYFMYR